MSLQEQFEKAVENLKVLKTAPSDEEQLILYGLFKQAMVGDCNTEQPGLPDANENTKWNAWKSHAGTTQDEAKQAYIDKVNVLLEKHGMLEFVHL